MASTKSVEAVFERQTSYEDVDHGPSSFDVEPKHMPSIAFFSDGSFQLDGESTKHPPTEASRNFLVSLKVDLEKQPGRSAPLLQANPVFQRQVSDNPALNYFERWIGTGTPPPPAPTFAILWAVVGSFFAIALLMIAEQMSINRSSELGHIKLVMLIGSFGAQAVLIFGAPGAPFAQPWNCIMGNAISATIGVASSMLVGDNIPGFVGIVLCSAIAVSFSIGAMLKFRCLHPPGGATALIFATGPPALKQIGFLYVLFPAIFSSALHVFIGCLINNLSTMPPRRYPAYWNAYKKSF